jgi:sugar transferase (PEP-CTERM system associated)
MPKIGTHEVPARTLLLVGVDGVAIILSLLAACAARTYRPYPDMFVHVSLWIKITLITIACVLSLYFNDLYDFQVVSRRDNLFVHTMQALGAACFFLALLFYISPASSLGRGTALFAAPLILALLLSWRLSANATNLLSRGNERVLIMGTGESGILLVRHILAHPEYNLKVVGFLDEHGQNIGLSLVNPKIIGDFANVEQVVAQERIDRIILSLKERRGSTPIKQLLNVKFGGVRIEDVHSCFERLHGRILLERLSPSWLILSDGFKKSRILLAAKRAMDILVSLTLLLIVSPLLPLIALAIYLDSGAPIYFRQTRAGHNGHEFELLKFRSMVQDAEKDGPRWAELSDSRITRVGRILRKTRLDEIPQLFNVLRGEMSLVGPRPERPFFCDQLEKEIPFYNLRHSIRPGLTGWAQVRFRYGANLDDARGKLEFDLFYLKNMSLFVDCAILFETAKVVILGRGAQ